jgi:hypothetical protein
MRYLQIKTSKLNLRNLNYKLKNLKRLVFLFLVDSLTCQLVNCSVTNIQNPAAFVKGFERFSRVVKEENYQLLGEKKLCE